MGRRGGLSSGGTKCGGCPLFQGINDACGDSKCNLGKVTGCACETSTGSILATIGAILGIIGALILIYLCWRARQKKKEKGVNEEAAEKQVELIRSWEDQIQRAGATPVTHQFGNSDPTMLHRAAMQVPNGPARMDPCSGKSLWVLPQGYSLAGSTEVHGDACVRMTSHLLKQNHVASGKVRDVPGKNAAAPTSDPRSAEQKTNDAKQILLLNQLSQISSGVSQKKEPSNTEQLGQPLMLPTNQQRSLPDPSFL